MYKISVENTGEYSFKAVTNGFKFNIDANGEAASPLDVFLASLGSCVGTFTRKYLEGAKIQSDKFIVAVE